MPGDFKHLALEVVFLGVTLLLVITGVLLIRDPHGFYPRLQGILSLRVLWGYPDPNPSLPKKTELRVVGAVFALLGTAMMVAMISGMMSSAPPQPQPLPSTTQPSNRSLDVYQLVAGVLLAIGAVYTVAAPAKVLHWFERGTVSRVREEMRGMLLWYVRIAGLFALTGAGSFLYWSGIFRIFK